MKTSTLARSLELAKLVTQVGLKEFGSADVKSRYEQAILIAKSLSQLKGAAMKMGQILSLDLDSYFPPEAIEVLSQLQNAAVAHPTEEITKILKIELLGKFKDIKNISEQAIGVASIGQVHSAKYKNQKIALKIQYPGIANSVDSDLKILQTLANTFCKISGRKMNLDPLFEEFNRILKQELDYSQEAKHQIEYRKKILEMNEALNYNFRVPIVIEEISTNKVIAMSYEKGLTLRNWLSTNPKQQVKDKCARAVLDLYFYEFFKWGKVQTDPNWGNFLIDQTQDEISLGVLDFGATRTYSKDFIQQYITLLETAAEKDWKKLKELSIHFGLMDARESELAFVAFQEMLSVAIKPFFHKKETANLNFNFADRNHEIQSQIAAKALAKELVYSPPPYSLVFLHRKLSGVYSVLKALQTQMDISPYWNMMKDLSKDLK